MIHYPSAKKESDKEPNWRAQHNSNSGLLFARALSPPNDVLVASSPKTTWFEQLGSAIIITTLLAGSAHVTLAFVIESPNEFAENNSEAAKQLSEKELKTLCRP